jgi:hypothetical protein
MTGIKQAIILICTCLVIGVVTIEDLNLC